MKKSKKITIGILIFFIAIAVVIGGRSAIGKHFKKKFSKRPPPGVIVEIVKEKSFSQTIESYCTALSSQTISFKIKKNELTEPIKLGKNVKKGDVIAKLSSKNIIAPFSGILGVRGITEDVLGSENSIIVTLDDSSEIYVDLKIPENFATVIKKDLSVIAKFSGIKDKIYKGKIDGVASRINAETRSILTRLKIDNPDYELIPGSLLEITLSTNKRDSLSIPDTSIILEGNKAYVYKVSKDNIANRSEIQIGLRNDGKVEVISGLNAGDIIVAEGLKKVRPNGKIKPLNK